MELRDLLGKLVTVHYHDRVEGPVLFTRHKMRMVQRRAYGPVLVCLSSKVEETRIGNGRATIVAYQGVTLSRKPEDETPQEVEVQTPTQPEAVTVDPVPTQEVDIGPAPAPVEEDVEVIEVFASQNAVKMLEKHPAIDPRNITGTGAEGKITQRDVSDYIEKLREEGLYDEGLQEG